MVWFSVAYWAFMLVLARIKRFWFDEIFTWNIAQSSDLATLFQYLGPTEPNPPGAYLITFGIHHLFGSGELVTRIPFILAFFVTCLLVYQAVERNHPWQSALTAALLLAASVPSLMAYEARGYAFVLLGSTLAWVSWRNYILNPHRYTYLAVLFVGLAVVPYFHYYGILIYLPLLLGELQRWWQTKRVDLPICITVSLALLTALPLIYLALSAAELRGLHWTLPSYSALLVACRQLYWPMIPGFLAAFISGWQSRFRFQRGDVCIDDNPVITSLLAWVLLPFAAFFLGLWFLDSFHYKYVITTGVGVVLFMHLVVFPRLKWSSRQWNIYLILVICLFTGVNGLRLVRHRQAADLLERVVNRVEIHCQTGTVTVAEPHLFAQLYHYSDPDTRRQLRYPIDYSLNFDYRALHRYSTSDISLTGLQKHKEFGVLPWEKFVQSSSESIVLVRQDLKRIRPWFIQVKEEERGIKLIEIIPDRRNPLLLYRINLEGMNPDSMPLGLDANSQALQGGIVQDIQIPV